MAAYVIKNFLGAQKTDSITFKTINGDILVDLSVSNQPSIQLKTPMLTSILAPKNIIEMIGSRPRCFFRSHDRYIAVLNNEKDIVNAKPNFGLIAQLDLHALVITAKSNQYDFVSRGFMPSIAINEDFVTGSSHAALAPYWGDLLNQRKLLARQLSSRPGNVYCTVEADGVTVSGSCYLFAKGEYML